MQVNEGRGGGVGGTENWLVSITSSVLLQIQERQTKRFRWLTHAPALIPEPPRDWPLVRPCTDCSAAPSSPSASAPAPASAGWAGPPRSARPVSLVRSQTCMFDSAAQMRIAQTQLTNIQPGQAVLMYTSCMIFFWTVQHVIVSVSGDAPAGMLFYWSMKECASHLMTENCFLLRTVWGFGLSRDSNLNLQLCFSFSVFWRWQIPDWDQQISVQWVVMKP